MEVIHHMLRKASGSKRTLNWPLPAQCRNDDKSDIRYTLLAYKKLAEKKYVQFVYSKSGLFHPEETCYDTNKREGENDVHIS